MSPSGASGSQLLQQAIALFGSGDFGDAPMARIAAQAIDAARAEGDRDTESVAHFFHLYPSLYVRSNDLLQQRLDQSRQRCEALGVARALWLLDELQAHVLALRGKHMEALAITQRLDRLSPDQRPALDRGISGLLAVRVLVWCGRLGEGLRRMHQCVQLAPSFHHPRLHAASLTALGTLYARDALLPEVGLPLLEQSRELLRGLPLMASTLLNAAHLVSAFDLLGERDQAYQAFLEITGRPGVLAMLSGQGSDLMGPVRSRLTVALILQGRLQEAETWLNVLPPEAYRSQIYRYETEPIMRVRLLCAQKRYAQARTLATQTRDQINVHVRTPHDELTLLDCLRESCEALGDLEAAKEAAMAARDACLPLVKTSAMARYLSLQLARDPLGAPPLSALDHRRLQAIEREVEAQSQPVAPATAAPGPSAAPAPGLADMPAQTPPAVPRFLAHVVHELRNPIGGMMGLSSLLLMSELDDKQRRYTSAMRSSANTLLQLVNDVLDLAKLESGTFMLQPVAFEVGPWLSEAVEPQVITGQMKGVVVSAQADAALSRPVLGDPLRLRQVLANLVGNALKFTRSGSVAVRARVQAGPAPGEQALRIEVQDTGIGIQPEALGRLFQEFVQADATISRDYGGTGLGLALCQRLMTQMGGRIGASSQPGQGSLFWFELPLAWAD